MEDREIRAALDRRHSRIREMTSGGVTRDVLVQTTRRC
jgi:hypothetical protein